MYSEVVLFQECAKLLNFYYNSASPSLPPPALGDGTERRVFLILLLRSGSNLHIDHDSETTESYSTYYAEIRKVVAPREWLGISSAPQSKLHSRGVGLNKVNRGSRVTQVMTRGCLT